MVTSREIVMKTTTLAAALLALLAHSARADEYLGKPFTADQLLALVRRFLR